MCIDVCPVGALTSGTYRYKTRPWEMNHVATVCTHCGDGCKTTLGVRSVDDGWRLCAATTATRAASTAISSASRAVMHSISQSPRPPDQTARPPGRWQVRRSELGAGARLRRRKAARDSRNQRRPVAIGVIGSNRTTNEENYLLQKFARTVLGTNNIDHHRTADYVSFVRALAGQPDRAASLRDTATAPAILLLGNDPTEQHPALAWNLRTNVRLNTARLYVVNANRHQAAAAGQGLPPHPGRRYADSVRFLAGNDGDFAGIEGAAEFRDALRAEPNLLIVFGSEYRGRDIEALVDFGLSLPETRLACLGDYANSRGAADMGVLPDLLPGYRPVSEPGAFAEEYGNLPQAPGRTCSRCSTQPSAANWRALCRWLQPGRALRHRSRFAQEHLPHRAGHVPDRDGAAGRSSSCPLPISMRRRAPSPTPMAICSW